MLVHDFHDALVGILDEGKAAYPEGVFQDLARHAMLSSVDMRWQEHLVNLDYLRSGIMLRSCAQREPLTKSAAQAPSFRHGVKPHVP